MPRQLVQDFDIQNFRNRVGDFQRRQSEDMDAYTNSRKRRSSQCWQDIQIQQMQFTENWRDDLCFNNHKKQRKSIPQYNGKTLSYGSVAPSARPIQALPAPSRRHSKKISISPPATVQQVPTIPTYIEPIHQQVQLPVMSDPVLPTIENEEFDMPSATFSRASSSTWESEPRTPEGSLGQSVTSEISQPEFLEMSTFADHHQIFTTPFVPHALPLSMGMTSMGNGVGGGGGGGGYDKGGYAGADFERAFEEFMNVS